jgi:hypothetical protein
MSDEVKIIILQDITAFIGALGAFLVFLLAEWARGSEGQSE